MNEFEKIQATLKRLKEEHGFTTLILQWGGQLAADGYRAGDCMSANIYIECPIAGEWAHHGHAKAFGVDLVQEIESAVDKFNERCDAVKAKNIAKAKALLAAAGE